tara:strand:- start:15 stop:182 length:168 start_codon:yes stop_codon:yes gene_type:complete
MQIVWVLETHYKDGRSEFDLYASEEVAKADKEAAEKTIDLEEVDYYIVYEKRVWQ